MRDRARRSVPDRRPLVHSRSCAAEAAVERPFDRAAMLERLAGETFDVLVVGGGITGAGVALDAATRGLRTALVEADDFASGTSSKSSKLVHGGLRYLQQGDVRLVYEALHERQRLRRNAPHLVKLLPFLIPILTKDGLIPRRVARALGSAMWMYDLTGGWRIGKLHQRLKADAALRPPADDARERLAGGYLYYDATTDDARLVLTLARTAAAARRRRRQPLPGRRPHQGRRRAGRRGHRRRRRRRVRRRAPVSSSTPPACGPTRCARSRTASTPTRSARPRASTSRCRGTKVRNDIAVVIPVPRRQAQPVRRAVGPRDRRHVRAHLRRHHRHRLRRPARRPAVHGRRHRLRARRAQRRGHHRTSRADDVTGVWAGLRPLVKSATQRPHRRPVPPPPRDDRARPASSASPAAS